MKKTVVELFAGVGGFRVGFNSVKLSKSGKTIEKPNFNFVWANQWEPSTKSQDAFICYETRFGKSPTHSNLDISKVDKKTIPDHSVLVGGFPCQDYSVARSLSNEMGIQGKKGVLWWQINEILKVKRPPFVLLENVDRLLSSPSKQRGRDFGVMLRCFEDLGYAVEWRVINAADYGFAQRRKRVFIFAYHKTTNYFKNVSLFDAEDIVIKKGFFADVFKVENKIDRVNSIDISKTKYKDLVEVSDSFEFRFQSSGYLVNGKIYTGRTEPIIKKAITLRQIMERNVDEKFYSIDEAKFKKLKEAKKINRVSKEGYKYIYSEGNMAYPDNIDLPARTMLTSESSVNRSTHIVKDLDTNKNRLITPIEAERLNGFPDNWTNTGMTDRKRYFMMGNALVTGIVEILGNKISQIIEIERKFID